jgi:hypothetical protein
VLMSILRNVEIRYNTTVARAVQPLPRAQGQR